MAGENESSASFKTPPQQHVPMQSYFIVYYQNQERIGNAKEKEEFEKQKQVFQMQRARKRIEFQMQFAQEKEDFQMQCAREKEMLMTREKEFENLRIKTNPRASHTNGFFKPNESRSSMNEKKTKNQRLKLQREITTISQINFSLEKTRNTINTS